MKNNDDNRLLENKRRIDAERRAKAIEREQQATLRRTTPGTATPLSIRQQRWVEQDRRAKA